MRFALLVIVVSFAAMEFVSYLAHRYFYHGLGWLFHENHHEPHGGVFEWDDIFPLIFSSITISQMLFGLADPERGDIVAFSLGIAAYGLIYFLFMICTSTVGQYG